MSTTETTGAAKEPSTPIERPRRRSDTSRPAIEKPTPNQLAPGGTTNTRQANPGATPIVDSPAGAVGRRAKHVATPEGRAPAGPPGQATTDVAAPIRGPLLDPVLALAADVLDDLERVRIANENRLRQLTRDVADTDGETRGFGLDERHPDVARLAAIVDMLRRLEHDAELQLGRVLKRHPLGPWMAGQVGIGAKQGGRLLAAIGDPYFNARDNRPRTVSELWAYCGYHVLPVGGQATLNVHSSTAADRAESPADQPGCDTHLSPVGGNSGDPGQKRRDDHIGSAGVAAKRQRGKRANWSTTAKMRAYLIAEQVIQCANPEYRAVYDARRAHTAERAHAVACVRCGPAGKPAAPGTPWSKGHQHADGLRIVAKTILRDLWREARRLHERPADHSRSDAHGSSVGGVPTSPAKQPPTLESAPRRAGAGPADQKVVDAQSVDVGGTASRSRSVVH